MADTAPTTAPAGDAPSSDPKSTAPAKKSSESPTKPDAKSTESPEASPDRYLVNCDLLGSASGATRDQVLTAADLPAHYDLDWLLQIGALKPASAMELQARDERIAQAALPQPEPTETPEVIASPPSGPTSSLVGPMLRTDGFSAPSPILRTDV